MHWTPECAISGETGLDPNGRARVEAGKQPQFRPFHGKDGVRPERDEKYFHPHEATAVSFQKYLHLLPSSALCSACCNLRSGYQAGSPACPTGIASLHHLAVGRSTELRQCLSQRHVSELL